MKRFKMTGAPRCAGLVAAWVAAMVCFASARSAHAAPASDPGAEYLNQLSKAVEATHKNLDAYTTSAQKAARRIIDGGRMLLAGPRRDFKTEGIGRAGGLMGLKWVGPKVTPKAGDVVLTSADAPWTEQEKQEMQQWVKDGAQLVVFASEAPFGDTFNTADSKVDLFIPASNPGLKVNDRFYPLDAVVNMVDLWTWTAEYVSACTRAGKMPILYQSYGIEGARDRAKKYKGQMFHSDFHIDPIQSGVLATQYLDAIQKYLKGLEGETDQLKQAGQWLREAGKDQSCLVGIGHTFPYIYQDERAPQPFGSMVKWTIVKKKPATIPANATLVFHLSYQYSPDELLQAAADGKYKLIYCSVQKGKTEGKNILYINPQWPLPDASVSIKGYDIPILPPSGVIQAAIYWSVVADAEGK